MGQRNPKSINGEERKPDIHKRRTRHDQKKLQGNNYEAINITGYNVGESSIRESVNCGAPKLIPGYVRRGARAIAMFLFRASSATGHLLRNGNLWLKFSSRMSILPFVTTYITY